MPSDHVQSGRQAQLFCRGDHYKMTNDAYLDMNIVKEIQAMCLRGESIPIICEYVWDRLGAERGDSMTAVHYFWRGFKIPLGDARWLEASPVCSGSALSISELEVKLRPMMSEHCLRVRDGQSTY